MVAGHYLQQPSLSLDGSRYIAVLMASNAGGWVVHIPDCKQTNYLKISQVKDVSYKTIGNEIFTLTSWIQAVPQSIFQCGILALSRAI